MYAIRSYYVSVGIEPCLRVRGRMMPLGSHKLDAATVTALLQECMSPAAFEQFVASREANFAIQRPQLGRFRVSAFWQQEQPGMVVRRISYNFV